jgi:tetratricopeptide (TPR) repeat protein
MGSLGNHYAEQYEHGDRDVIGALRAEEQNLLHARTLARRKGWWDAVTTTMQGLHQLHNHTGRRGEWARLVNEVVPDFVDPPTDGPLPGREEDWGPVTAYRVRLAMEARQWAEAERLQEICVDWDRKRAREDNRNSLRTLAISLHDLGEIRREMGLADCVMLYRKSYELAEKIADSAVTATVAYNLGSAYLDSSDLAEAERWYRKSLGLRSQGDRMGRAKSLGQLGHVAYERFLEARTNGRPPAELGRHSKEAIDFYDQALQLTPVDAVGQLAIIHNSLGAVLNDARELDRALPHYRESIRYYEAAGNPYGAAKTRYNVALALLQANRFADAMEYAKAALRNFQTFGAGAADWVQKTLNLIAEIDKDSQTLQ